MANFNKVLLMGNLTRDPEMRYTQSGQAVVNLGLAVNRKYRNRNTNELVEETTFVDIEAWGAQAETINQYMSKGRPIFIEGRLKLDTWEDRQTGDKRSKMRVVCENFQFMGGGGANAGGPRGERSEPAPRQQSRPSQPSKVSERGGDAQPAEDYDFDDIPF